MNLQKIKDNFNKKDGSMYGKKNIDDSLAILFHENSKFDDISIRKQGYKIASFSNPYVTERSSQPFKCYSGCETIELSQYNNINKSDDFSNLIANRRSIRAYDKNYKVSLNEINTLLFNSYGVTFNSKIVGYDIDGHIGLRNIVSAGGLYPLEVYIVVFNSHIKNGLYHYRPDTNILELIKEGAFVEELLKIVQAEPYVDMRSSCCAIITTGVIERLIIKYGDRGYRFLMQEVGSFNQMVSLLAESINLGSCILGAFNDDKINNFIGIDGVFETVNNVIVFGGKMETNLNCEI